MLFKHRGRRALHREFTNPPSHAFTPRSLGMENLSLEVLFTVLLLFVFILHPSSLKAQLITNQEHLTISSFNDSWGGGFTEIRDDQRSFGLTADYQFLAFKKVMQIKLDYAALTNRFAKPDSGRIDQLELFVRYPVYQPNPEITLNVLGGMYWAGNLGGQKIQNLVHSSVGVNEFNLPYPPTTAAFGFVGLSFWWIKPVVILEDDNHFNLEFQAENRFAPNYVTNNFFNAGISVSNALADKISLLAGYQNQNVQLKNEARKQVGRTESGFFINYGMRAGFFNYGIRIYPATNFAVGTIGISIFSDDKKARYKPSMREPDVLFDFGALLDGGLFMRLSTIPYNNGIDWVRISFEARYQYWTYGRTELGSDPKQLGHYQQATVGSSVSFFSIKQQMQLLPYVAFGFGFRGEYLYKADNPEDRKTVNSFATSLESGLRLKFPSFGFDKNCYYGLSCSGIMSFTNKEEDAIYYGDFQFGKTLYQLGLGGFVMVDF